MTLREVSGAFERRRCIEKCDGAWRGPAGEDKSLKPAGRMNKSVTFSQASTWFSPCICDIPMATSSKYHRLGQFEIFMDVNIPPTSMKKDICLEYWMLQATLDICHACRTKGCKYTLQKVIVAAILTSCSGITVIVLGYARKRDGICRIAINLPLNAMLIKEKIKKMNETILRKYLHLANVPSNWLSSGHQHLRLRIYQTTRLPKCLPSLTICWKPRWKVRILHIKHVTINGCRASHRSQMT